VSLQSYESTFNTLFALLAARFCSRKIISATTHFSPRKNRTHRQHVDCGLCAKPIIDILIGVGDKSQLDIPVPEIQDLGYQYISRYENEMPYRRFFLKEKDAVRTHQIHMVAYKSTFWVRHLQFRDYLRARSEIAEEYAVLKRQLAERDWESVNDYADAKTAFIRRIEAAAKNLDVEQY